MELALKNKNIMVVGSAGLIGSEISKELVVSGAKVIMVDANEKNAWIAQQLKNEHIQSLIINKELDMSKEESAKDLTQLVESHFNGVLHGLVNCIQFKSKSFFVDIDKTSETELHDIFAANVYSIFYLFKALLPYLRNANGASVVTFSSTYALVSPNPVIYEGTKMGCPPAYVATKGAVHSLTKYLACYYAKENIRVNSVSPHGVHNGHEKKFVENFSRLSPINRMSEKEEVAPVVLFLLSNKSSYITGANIKVDGGWTAW